MSRVGPPIRPTPVFPTTGVGADPTDLRPVAGDPPVTPDPRLRLGPLPCVAPSRRSFYTSGTGFGDGREGSVGSVTLVPRDEVAGAVVPPKHAADVVLAGVLSNEAQDAL